MIPTKEEWIKALEERHGQTLQQKFASASVAVCGLGGLGSNISLCLARAGIGRLILIDFDRVDITNLHRQQYKAHQIGMYKTEALAENLREIVPYLSLELHTETMTEENTPQLLQNAQIICEAFDRAENKAMLVNYLLEHRPDTFIVSGSGMAGYGSSNSIHTEKRMKNLYLCGDGTSDIASGISLTAPRVTLCAAHQANMILRLILGEKDV